MKVTSHLIPIITVAVAAFFMSCSDEKNKESSRKSSAQNTTSEYQANDADRKVFKTFEDVYKVASTAGKRNGLNGLEILLAAAEAMDWSEASLQLNNAVNELKSIQSGEEPDSRNKKMEKFMDIFEMY